MYSKDLSEFIEDVLCPSMFEKLDSVFPEMNFKRKGKNWISPFRMDGTTPSRPRPDKSFVTPLYHKIICENGESTHKTLIDLYSELNGKDFISSVEAICSILGLEFPKDSGDWNSYKERQSRLSESLYRQMEALHTTEEGKKVLVYLKDYRHYSDEDIKQMKLGYISPDEAKRIDDIVGIPQIELSDFPLSIPYFSKGTLKGFKFRYITEEARQKYGKSKYRNTKNLSSIMNKNPFGLTGLHLSGDNVKDRTIILVEGELDALHAQAKGVQNIIATSGGKLTDDTAIVLREKGVQNIVLLLDEDTPGKNFIENSLTIADRNGLTPVIASLPSGDPDEFLRSHSVEELQTIIDRAELPSTYLYNTLIEQNLEKNGGDLTPLQYLDLLSDIANIIDRPFTSPLSTDQIIKNLSECSGMSRETLVIEIDKRRKQNSDKQNKKTQETAVKEAIKKASTMITNGNIVGAISTMAGTESLLEIDKSSKYQNLLTTRPTRADIKSRLSSKPDGIPTEYAFKNQQGEMERLVLPSGAVTFVCAPTSHGKSTLLQNLALQVAKREEDGSVLYFTYEEDMDSVILQFVNKYGNEFYSRNNLRTIHSYYRGSNYFVNGDSSTFDKKEDEFYTRLYDTGKLMVFYEDYSSDELIEAIRELSREIKVKAVFIDYVQLLHKRGSRSERKDELRDICDDFMKLSIEIKSPIVLASQFNRDAKSPIEMHSQNTAESSQIEKSANTIIAMWNSSFTPLNGSIYNKTDGKQERERLESLGFNIGRGGKIYAKLLKNRGGSVGIDTVLDFNGNTGVIEPNYTPKEPQQETLSDFLQQNRPPIF